MPTRGPVPVNLCTSTQAETLKVGPLTIKVLEDGTNTQDRVSSVTILLPGGACGPPMHWHRFHDELFFVTKGTIVFSTPEGEQEARVGDLMTVPPGAVHTFRNGSGEEEAECYMTATPGHYVDYFRMLAKATEEGKMLGKEEVGHLMSLFGTFPPEVDSEP
ncbi:RmlC-like cupin domain-containing protein [Triangularia verruculosa]|uniref:RmlC-like cupin domain-containing protein n=1 Tax=Triangularia verruculosa TaxID=2587418 RepID=A0AAN7AU11_9PEZI|nr:RmlC-like cupin domain-containing protein [Triangularia verruculosa]